MYKKSISFICPVFNDGNSIKKMVESIRDQDLPDIEIITINDGSTDNSKEVLDALKKSGDIDEVIHFEKNRGACVARNEGAKIAQGKYFSFLPADAILYPGMARIWYNALEDNPDYDFVYGGYRLITEEGDPIAGCDYFFQPFDPYLLEVTNYIDGSFPLRAESFWKYAEIMKQDGLWDPNIKSLQDWDFWLSVVKNGGKGIYIQDIFFGTTPPHPGGLSYDSAANWITRLSEIKKKHSIPERKLCVASLGAGWHAKRIAYMLGADFKEMPSFKPHSYDAIYAIGFYPEFATQQDKMFWNTFDKQEEGRTPAKKLVHFVGSDVWQLFHTSLVSLKFWRDYFKNAVDVLLCESDFIQDELKELGIENVHIVPIPPAKLYELRPLPKEFTIACYLPGMNRDFYQPQAMIEIAKKCPDVKFKFFGNLAQKGSDPALPNNIFYEGYITDMDAFISECSAIIRFPLHDGLPLSVLEFLLAGRYSIQSVPIKYTQCLKDFSMEKVDMVVQAIKELKAHVEKNGLNIEASEYWRKELDHGKYASAIKSISIYNPKQYWEKRARSWADDSNKYPIEHEEVKKIFDKINHKSVLEVGCGDARWYQHLKEWGVEEYHGVDISENLIKAAQFRFPHLKNELEVSKVEDFIPKKKYDVVFSYTVFEHITHEDFPRAVESLKRMADYAILVEPTDFTSRYYCFSHSYEKNFKIIEKIKLSNKTIFLCDLT